MSTRAKRRGAKLASYSEGRSDTQKSRQAMPTTGELVALWDEALAEEAAVNKNVEAEIFLPVSEGAGLYQFTQIVGFDARRGYRRCTPPGVEVCESEQSATSDHWRNRDGNVVVRFSSQGYQFSFEVVRSSGAKLLGDEMDGFANYVSDLLFLWIVEGVDDTPSV